MAPMGRRFATELEIEVVQFRPGERKIAERVEHFDCAERLVYIGKAQEKASVVRTEKRRSRTRADLPVDRPFDGDGE